MQSFTILLAVAAAISTVYAGTGYESDDDYEYDSDHSNMTYTTSIVTAYTTYCPEATKITYGTHTYTVTEATTLTIEDCPCTVTMPVHTSTVTTCSTW